MLLFGWNMNSSILITGHHERIAKKIRMKIYCLVVAFLLVGKVTTAQVIKNTEHILKAQME